MFDAIDKIRASRDRSTTGAAEAFQIAKNRLFTREAGSHPSEIRVSLTVASFWSFTIAISPNSSSQNGALRESTPLVFTPQMV